MSATRLRLGLLGLTLALLATPARAQRGPAPCDLLGFEAAKQRAALDRDGTLPRREARDADSALFSDATLARLDAYIRASRRDSATDVTSTVMGACRRDSPASAGPGGYLQWMCGETMPLAAEGYQLRRSGLAEGAAISRVTGRIRAGFHREAEMAVRHGYRSGAPSADAAAGSWLRLCVRADEIRFP